MRRNLFAEAEPPVVDGTSAREVFLSVARCPNVRRNLESDAAHRCRVQSQFLRHNLGLACPVLELRKTRVLMGRAWYARLEGTA